MGVDQSNQLTAKLDPLNLPPARWLRRLHETIVTTGAAGMVAIGEVVSFHIQPGGEPASHHAASPVSSTRTRMPDPFTVDLYTRLKRKLKPWVEPSKSSHIWRAPLPTDVGPGVHRVIVIARDEYGRSQISATLSRSARARASRYNFALRLSKSGAPVDMQPETFEEYLSAHSVIASRRE